jgi:hypothetical protein
MHPPSITISPSTVHTVVNRARHFSGISSFTVTVACTVSPARIGALKCRFWPIFVPGPDNRPAIAAEMTLADSMPWAMRPLNCVVCANSWLMSVVVA